MLRNVQHLHHILFRESRKIPVDTTTWKQKIVKLNTEMPHILIFLWMVSDLGRLPSSLGLNQHFSRPPSRWSILLRWVFLWRLSCLGAIVSNLPMVWWQWGFHPWIWLDGTAVVHAKLFQTAFYGRGDPYRQCILLFRPSVWRLPSRSSPSIVYSSSRYFWNRLFRRLVLSLRTIDQLSWLVTGLVTGLFALSMLGRIQ